VTLPFASAQLIAFVAVADHGHVTRAAEALGVTQSTVTHHVRTLERTLGVGLLERSGRSIRLTDAGRALVPVARIATRALQEVADTAHELRDTARGRIRVAASQTTAVHHLPALLTDFLARRSRVDVDILPGNTAYVCSLVADGTVDVGLIEGERTVATLVEKRLVEDEVLLVVAAGHPLAARRTGPADLAAHRYLAREPGSGTESMAAEMLGPVYQRLRRVQVGQMDAVKAGAVNGLGFAALPRVAIDSELRSGALVALPFTARRRWIRAVRRAPRGGPLLEALWAGLATAGEPAVPDGADPAA
jgi:DNA-binding transcriptional LysR family regulator